MKIVFIPMGESHLPLFRRWLKEPHVQPHWNEPEDESELREKFLTRLPERGFSPFIVEVDQQPIGYMQYYEACRAGGGWWPNAAPGVFGIDQMIGEPAWTGKGLAKVLIEKFIQLISERESASEIIIDPDPENHRAIRAFEKAGFARIGVIETPNGKAMLMKRSLIRPRIRKMEATDSLQVAQVHVLSWQQAYRGIVDQGFLDSIDLKKREANWRVGIESNAPPLIRLVYETQGQVVAFTCGLENRSPVDLPLCDGELWAIYCRPDHARRGIGGALLNQFKTELKATGKRRFCVWVLRDNTVARYFYERHGGILSRASKTFQIGEQKLPEVAYEFDL